MVNIKTVHKTSQKHREAVKKNEDNIRADPERNEKRLQYHRDRYLRMKEALKQFQKMQQIESSKV